MIWEDENVEKFVRDYFRIASTTFDIKLRRCWVLLRNNRESLLFKKKKNLFLNTLYIDVKFISYSNSCSYLLKLLYFWIVCDIFIYLVNIKRITFLKSYFNYPFKRNGYCKTRMEVSLQFAPLNFIILQFLLFSSLDYSQLQIVHHKLLLLNFTIIISSYTG